MSFSCASSFASRMFRHTGVILRGSAPSGVLSGRCHLAQSQRTLTRSMWYLCRSRDLQQTANTNTTPWNKTCGCCGIHTEGDIEIAEFLKEEIKYEKNQEKKDVSKVRDFEVTTSTGTNIELTRKHKNETITVKFNVNNSIDDEAALELQENEQANEEEAQMVSRPPFIVEICKGGASTIAIQCAFPIDKYPGGETQEGEYEDLIEIEEVTLLGKDQKWDETVYAVSGANLDGNLYDMFLNMLEERGVTEEFINDLVAFSTSNEHKKYVNFLENLQDFVSSK